MQRDSQKDSDLIKKILDDIETSLTDQVARDVLECVSRKHLNIAETETRRLVQMLQNTVRQKFADAKKSVDRQVSRRGKRE